MSERHRKGDFTMAKKWPLGQLFKRDGNDLEDEYKVLSAMGAEEKELPKKAAESAPMQETGDTVYFAEIKGALLGVWENGREILCRLR